MRQSQWFLKNLCTNFRMSIQRDKKKVGAKSAVEKEGGDKKEQENTAGDKENAGVSSKTPNKSKKSKK